MEEAIKEKLRNALTEPIEKECQVLYILAEIRKLLDWGKKEFPVLRFYSNWALHIEIEKTGAVNGILKKIEETIRKGKYEIETVLNFIDFEEFRKEIKKFLEDLNLPYDLFTSYKNWGNFRRLFVDILTDCSLKPKHGGIEYFSFRIRIVLRRPIHINLLFLISTMIYRS